MKDIVFDVVCVELDTEGEELKDKAEELHSARVIRLRLVVCSVGQQWSCRGEKHTYMSCCGLT